MPAATAVLVNVPALFLQDDRRQPPGGLVSIATYADRLGYDISICDLAGETLTRSLCDNIPEADIYGFSCYTPTYQETLLLQRELRDRYPQAIFVAGGPHASALPEDVARDFDCVVTGEGEEAFAEILRCVSTRQRARIPRTWHASPILKLDDLPFPDFEHFCTMTRYTRRLHGEPTICLDSSRGCNNRCRFCNSHVNPRGFWRARSARSIAEEVKWHYERGWRAYRFNDDHFVADPARTIEICELLAPLKITFRIFSRAESFINREVCEWLVRAGCRHVGVGIESFSSRILALMGKATSVARITAGLHTAREYGLTVRGFFIVGFPGETDETVRESLAILADTPLDEATVYPCIPYPGSALFDDPGHYGINWMDPDYSHYVQVGRDRSTGYVMRTATFGAAEMRRWRDDYMATFSRLGIAWCDERKEII